MQETLNIKLKAMLWDMPEKRRLELSEEIQSNPADVFCKDEQVFLKVLNSLNWYELTRLISVQKLLPLLTDSTIQKLYPVQRRKYYINARRLLSKYVVSSAG